MVKDKPTIDAALRPVLRRYLLGAADDKLVLGHRNGEWTGLGPFLEADIAFSNIAQDELAHAAELYKLVALLDDPAAQATRIANELAYGRPVTERYNATVLERADGFDWAVAVTRQCLFDHYDAVRLPLLQKSTYAPLAALAGKMLQEVSFHVIHFDDWLVRLGRGGTDARDRVQSAVDTLWPGIGGLFAPVADEQELVAAGIVPEARALADGWRRDVVDLLNRAGLSAPTDQPQWTDPGRSGQHDARLAELLAEFAEVYQTDPQAEW